MHIDETMNARLNLLPRERVPELWRAMPKAELHVHIEGTLEPEMTFALAKRNHVRLALSDVDSLRQACAFTNLQSFLDVYYASASVLRTEADFFDLASAYLARAAAEEVVRAEIFFDPQTHTARGVPFRVVMRGLERAAAHAEATLDISVGYIMCFLRHLSEEDAFAALAEAEPFIGGWPRLIGFGLDSSERDNPPSKFARVFARCRALGLHLVAHAGEEGPPAYIWEALDVLEVERVDHGVRCMEDGALVERLVRDRTPLTVCPLSNLRLCVVRDLADHNLDAMLAAGIRASVNSDDPAYFGGYVNQTFARVFDAKPSLGAREAYVLARNSLEGSFATAEQKAAWTTTLDRTVMAFTERF
ncbi:MAG: adenosine deaminase [Acidobacteriota bacterium]